MRSQRKLQNSKAQYIAFVQGNVYSTPHFSRTSVATLLQDPASPIWRIMSPTTETKQLGGDHFSDHNLSGLGGGGDQSLESVTEVKRQAHPDTDAGSDDISAQLLPFVDPIMRPAAPAYIPCACMRSYRSLVKLNDDVVIVAY